MCYGKNVCVQLISEVCGGFHFQMTGYSRLGGKKAIVGTVVNLLGRTSLIECGFTNGYG